MTMRYVEPLLKAQHFLLLSYIYHIITLYFGKINCYITFFHYALFLTTS